MIEFLDDIFSADLLLEPHAVCHIAKLYIYSDILLQRINKGSDFRRNFISR